MAVSGNIKGSEVRLFSFLLVQDERDGAEQKSNYQQNFRRLFPGKPLHLKKLRQLNDVHQRWQNQEANGGPSDLLHVLFKIPAERKILAESQIASLHVLANVLDVSAAFFHGEIDAQRGF